MTSEATPTVRTVKVCTVDGCEGKHYGLGLCRPHYRVQRRATHGRQEKPREAACVVCGAAVTRSSSRKHLPTCSYKCRRDLTFGISEPIPEDHPARWFGASCPWTPPKLQSKLPRFADTRCADCDARYIVDILVGGLHAGTYCSPICQARAARRRRRGRERGLAESFRWSDVIGLWLKQGRACAYCLVEMTTQPDPDHVLALSRGGRNVIANILPCCPSCNNDKSDLTLDEWSAERARRGKPPVRTDYVTYDPRAPHLVVCEPTGPAWRHRSA